MDKGSRKDEWLKLRIDRATRDLFKAQARLQGVSMSEVLRAAILAACAGPGPGKDGRDEREAQA